MKSDNNTIKLDYGQGCLELLAGEEVEVVLPRELPPAGAGVVRRSLDQAVGRKLEDFAGARSASILVSDITRPAPSHLMLPPLVRRLGELNITDLSVVFALGTHRRMSPAEGEYLLRECIRLPNTQHDPKACISLGFTERGTPVEILESVASSDLIVATGNIEYHYYAGYSGGAKAILPGVSSEPSVVRNHELMRDPAATTGNLKSPVRQDMEEAARIADLDFILNTVLNSRKEIVLSTAGDYIKAHRIGAAAVDRMYRCPVERADIVVSCAGGRPKDINLFQAQKALDNAKNAALPGGSIILLAECSEGLGHPVFERWACEASSAEQCWERFGIEYEFGGHKAAFLAKESLEHHLILVSSMPRDKVEMCFMNPARTLEEALSQAWKRQGRSARMLVMPYGNLTLAVGK